MQTILLDIVAWDFVLDTNGNIAIASEPYSLAQDAASEVQTFLGELYFDKTVGINYSLIFGKAPSLPLFKASVVAAVLDNGTSGVPDVTGAQCFIASISNRALSGQIQVTNNTGASASQKAVANFSVANFQGLVG